ncbi:MAG: YggS family pyridoxal phosphate-dependent enzyme [Oscillatoriales cyanobacterium RM2_1_1]|nr:YggS family pyridoxal phosphate-dependent enzyme [Oscillatoriales cyanobacterium SM2_3_0]NJO45629.1 YggS family pyridoxal phosphate-dependent enzyme [Oscillatoriales cyanobacterium RM2_1_1]
MTDSIAHRIHQLRATLPETVRLIAVSKTFPAEAIRQAYGAGIRDFGESKVQEAIDKQTQLSDLPDITWHLIGHLQSNKALKALQHFQWIHSVDSLKLAQRLDRLAQESNCTPNACLQVKLLPDPNKFGWSISQLQTDLFDLNQCQSLKIKGLMTILPQGLTASESLEVFHQTKKLATDINQQSWQNLAIQELSMGMSEDFSLAISAGATMIRLGRTIFGARVTQLR